MTGSTTHTGSGAGEAIRKGVGLVHGTGEALRGNFNATVDGIAGDRAGVHKNEAIAARGTDEMDHGYHHDRGTGAGVTPIDTSAERQYRNIQGEHTHGTIPTNHGPHATNIGNKVDPRIDSDLDGRGVNPAYGNPAYDKFSTKFAHHQTHALNKEAKLDIDHRGVDYCNGQCSSNYGSHPINPAYRSDLRYNPGLNYHTEGDLKGTGFNRPPQEMMQRSTHEHGHGTTSGTDYTQLCRTHRPYVYHDGYISSMMDPRIDSTLDHCVCFSDMWRDSPRSTTPYRPAPPLRRQSEPLQYYVTDFNTAKPPNAAGQAPWRPLPLLSPPDPYISYPPSHLYNHEYLHGFPYPYEDTNSHSYIAQRADAPKWKAKAEPQAQSQRAPHSNRITKILDLRTPTPVPKGSPHSTQYPHKSGWLKLLDPRVDRKAARKDRGRSD